VWNPSVVKVKSAARAQFIFADFKACTKDLLGVFSQILVHGFLFVVLCHKLIEQIAADHFERRCEEEK
jgi:hypothetical protein